MITGRVLHDEDGTRFVELSASYNGYNYNPLEQKVVMFTKGYHSHAEFISIADGEQKQFSLTREELDVLITSYQSYLIDQEAARVAQASQPSSWEDDDFPF